jgi:hypothetical protein
MRLPILALVGVAIALQTGCVTGRRALSLPVATHVVTSPTRGQVYIASITDTRHFENRPSGPAIRSIDGDVCQTELGFRALARELIPSNSQPARFARVVNWSYATFGRLVSLRE